MSRSFLIKKYLLVVAVAIVLSLVIITNKSRDNVPFCVNSAGCRADNTLRGKVSTTSYGFPAMYKQESTFNPANTNENSGGYAGYAEAKITTKPFHLLSLIANLVFWTALLLIPARFIRPRSKATPVLPPEDLQSHLS